MSTLGLRKTKSTNCSNLKSVIKHSPAYICLSLRPGLPALPQSQFEEETEAEFSKLPPPPTDIFAGEKIFRKILNNTSKTTIPAGRIRNIYPEVPSDTADKIKQRDDIPESDPNSPNIAQLNIEINKEINDHRRDKW